MNIKRYVASITILILVLGLFSLQGVSANNKVDEKLLQQAIDFREMHGFDTRIGYNEDILKRPITTELGKIFGFPITEEEVEVLKFREQMLGAASEFKETLIVNYEDVFAGIHYEPKSGEVIVQVTDTDPIVTAGISKIFKYADHLKIQLVDFTYSELETVKKSLLDNMELLKSASVNNIYIDVSKNKIMLNSKEGLEVNVEEIGKHFDLKYLEVGQQTYGLAGKEVDLGKYISGYFPSISATSKCSSGFFARDSAGYNVLVTAGHCFKTSFPSNWYNGGIISSTNYIGDYFYKKTTSSGQTQNSDSGYIRVTPDTTMKSTIEIGNSTVPLKYVNTRDEIYGEYIYRKGYVSGVGSGTYNGGMCVLNYDDPDVDGYVCDLALLDNIHSAEGDSGGTVFKLNAAGEATLFGITTGYLDTNNDGIKDATVYSRIKHVKTELGLQQIYGN